MIEVVLFDGGFRPDGVQQLLLRHEPPGILDQHAQRVEDLQPQRDHLRAARETAFARVELKSARTGRRLGPECRPRIPPQESFRNTPAFSKDGGGPPILPSQSRGTETREGETKHAETAS